MNMEGNGFPWQNSQGNTQQSGRTTQPPGFPNIRMNNQPIPMASFPPLNGHWVNSMDDILPRDVPNDGSAGWFPANDFSFVTMRRWNNQGTFDTIVYIPFQPNQQAQPNLQNDSSASTMSLDALMNVINARFDKLEKAVAKKQYYRKPINKQKENE